MFKYINAKIKNLKWFDFKVAGFYGIALGLILVKIWPGLADISVWWSIGAAVLFAGYFCFRLFRK